MPKTTKPATSFALFQEKTVRRVWYQDRWFFSVIDVIAILTESERPRKYWNDLKTKLTKEGYIEVSEKIGQLKMQVVTPTNYRYLTSGTKKHKRLEQGNAPGEGQKSNEKEGEI